MDYFGLQFQSKHGSSLRWVEREAVLKKHLTKFGRVSQLKPEGHLTFGVQYFTNNIGALTDEIARLVAPRHETAYTARLGEKYSLQSDTVGTLKSVLLNTQNWLSCYLG